MSPGEWEAWKAAGRPRDPDGGARLVGAIERVELDRAAWDALYGEMWAAHAGGGPITRSPGGPLVRVAGIEAEHQVDGRELRVVFSDGRELRAAERRTPAADFERQYLRRLEAVATAAADFRAAFEPGNELESYVEAFQSMGEALDALERFKRGEG
jgi:hypothetical protein